MKVLSRVFASVLVILVGLITLIGLLVNGSIASPDDNVGVQVVTSVLSLPSMFFVRLVSLAIAATVIIGIINLLQVHLVRLTRQDKNIRRRWFSAVVVLAFTVTIIANIADRNLGVALLENVQVPIESALAGLLFISLVYGAFRIMRYRTTPGSALFVVSMLIVLIGTLTMPGLAVVTDLRDWLLQVPVNAGARGILLGIALATFVTGVRVIIGQDRSYRE